DSGGPQGTFAGDDGGHVYTVRPDAGPDAAAGGTGAMSGGPDAGTDASGRGATASLDAGSDASTSDDAASDANGGLWVDSRAAYCEGLGPPITVGDSVAGVPTCTGAIAELTFTHALCTCDGANVQGVFATDSLDSVLATGQAPIPNGAPVGVNDALTVAGVPDIGGSLRVTGPNGFVFAGAAEVHGDLEVSNDVSLAGVSAVDRDLWVGGGLTSAGTLAIGRDLHQAPGHLAIGLVTVGGSTVSAPFTLAPPCACGAKQLLDIAGIVAEGESQNDNASIGLDPDAFDAFAGAADIELPCGRFYLHQVAGAGAIRFGVQGRTALFVDGSIATAGAFDFDVGPAGELDVFVTGDFQPTGATVFGQATRPAAVRVYVGGAGLVAFTGANEFVGNVYAPRATVTVTGYSDFYGSIFANEFEAPGDMRIHFDRGVLAEGDECPPPSSPPADASAPLPDASVAPPDASTPDATSPVPDAGTPPAEAGSPPAGPDASTSPPPPPPVCQTCGTCSGGTACVGGTCGSCSYDSDCCSPLVCDNGTCHELIVPR
ncbi:MAG TPA: collagen-binding domain-containing protein, partial [Polyangiaceae bacterium]|nr:collagen-binding domain-containing protein [Polyangiaceae bacterium]